MVNYRARASSFILSPTRNLWNFTIKSAPHHTDFHNQSAPHHTDFGRFYSLNLRKKKQDTERMTDKGMPQKKKKEQLRERLRKRKFLKLESPMPQHSIQKQTRRKKIRLYHQRFNLDTRKSFMIVKTEKQSPG